MATKLCTPANRTASDEQAGDIQLARSCAGFVKF